MTKADLKRIETQLGIMLPEAYRDLMASRSTKLKDYTHEVNGQTCGLFDDLLFLAPNHVIETNLLQRQPGSGTETEFPKWSKDFFLIGTNGGGDYYCLRLKGKPIVWMIGSDCGDKPTKISNSLAEFVDDEIQRLEDNSIAISSFNNSLPFEHRFSVSIARQQCQINCLEGDRPITKGKLIKHGIDTNELEDCAIQLFSVLVGCDPSLTTVKFDSSPSADGGAILVFDPVAIADSRFDGVSANIGSGMIIVSLSGPKTSTPSPEKAGIRWTTFRSAVSDLFKALLPDASQMAISKPTTSKLSFPGEWCYQMSYSIM